MPTTERELAKYLAQIVATGREPENPDNLVLNLDLPVMHQFLNVEGLRKYHGIEITDKEWEDFMDDYEADICAAWREIFLQFLQERPPIKTLHYPACCARRNAGHPEYAGLSAEPPALTKEEEEQQDKELEELGVIIIRPGIEIMNDDDFLKEIQGLEEGE